MFSKKEQAAAQAAVGSTTPMNLPPQRIADAIKNASPAQRAAAQKYLDANPNSIAAKIAAAHPKLKAQLTEKAEPPEPQPPQASRAPVRTQRYTGSR